MENTVTPKPTAMSRQEIIMDNGDIIDDLFEPEKKEPGKKNETQHPAIKEKKTPARKAATPRKKSSPVEISAPSASSAPSAPSAPSASSVSSAPIVPSASSGQFNAEMEVDETKKMQQQPKKSRPKKTKTDDVPLPTADGDTDSLPHGNSVTVDPDPVASKKPAAPRRNPPKPKAEPAKAKDENAGGGCDDVTNPDVQKVHPSVAAAPSSTNVLPSERVADSLPHGNSVTPPDPVANKKPAAPRRNPPKPKAEPAKAKDENAGAGCDDVTIADVEKVHPSVAAAPSSTNVLPSDKITDSLSHGNSVTVDPDPVANKKPAAPRRNPPKPKTEPAKAKDENAAGGCDDVTIADVEKVHPSVAAPSADAVPQKSQTPKKKKQSKSVTGANVAAMLSAVHVESTHNGNVSEIKPVSTVPTTNDATQNTSADADESPNVTDPVVAEKKDQPRSRARPKKNVGSDVTGADTNMAPKSASNKKTAAPRPKKKCPTDHSVANTEVTDNLISDARSRPEDNKSERLKRKASPLSERAKKQATQDCSAESLYSDFADENSGQGDNGESNDGEGDNEMDNENSTKSQPGEALLCAPEEKSFDSFWVKRLSELGLPFRKGKPEDEGYSLLMRCCLDPVISLFCKTLSNDLIRGPVPAKYAVQMMEFFSQPLPNVYTPRLQRPIAFYACSEQENVQVYLVFASKYTTAPFK